MKMYIIRYSEFDGMNTLNYVGDVVYTSLGKAQEYLEMKYPKLTNANFVNDWDKKVKASYEVGSCEWADVVELEVAR